MNFETIACELEDRVLVARLNRPDFLNAYTVDMANELVRRFEEASENDDVGTIMADGPVGASEVADLL